MKIKNTGIVEEVKDGVIKASGLSEAGASELVIINTQHGDKVYGLALNLEEDNVGIITLGDFKHISEGDIIETTGELPSIEVSDSLLGRIVDPIGNILDGKSVEHKNSKKMALEKVAPGVIERKDVDRPIQTGIKVIDSTLPIGRGQRQLIIGDRQTGKTTIGIDTIINQRHVEKELGLPKVYCIYVAIGQKASKIAQIKALLEKEGAMDYTVIVSATASDPASLQYLAPYAGCAIGEYFAEQGKDALVIYDDLTKHAWAYREISLLLRRPPGREAYPGDIFYLHSKLLERAVQFSDDNKGGSLTALPVIETQAGDVSAYIPTNVISITDGQIYLEPDLFNSGTRPAVNVGLSVSRVGGAAQLKPMKQVAGQLRLELAQYRELAAFAQFGSDLDSETKMRLDRGESLTELLKQNQYSPVETAVQVAIIYAATNGFIDEVEVNEIAEWEEKFTRFIKKEAQNELVKIAQNNKIEGELESGLVDAIKRFNK